MTVKKFFVRNFKKILSRNKPIILAYHSIHNSKLDFPIWTFLKEDKFEDQMSLIAKKYNCISLSELITDIKNNTIKPRTVVITLDDGFENNYTVAYPILKKYNLPATIFLTAGYIGTDKIIWPDRVALIVGSMDKEIVFRGKSLPTATQEDKSLASRTIGIEMKRLHPYDIDNEIEEICTTNNINLHSLTKRDVYEGFKILNWHQIQEMKESGLVEFGSHTVNHTILNKLTLVQAKDELIESKKIIEDKIGPISSFAYPNGQLGDFGDEHRQLAIDAGYKCVLTGLMGAVSNKSDPFALDRVGIGPESTSETLDLALSGGVAYGGGFKLVNKIRSVFKS